MYISHVYLNQMTKKQKLVDILRFPFLSTASITTQLNLKSYMLE